jgi:phage baseplate assembly protein W
MSEKEEEFPFEEFVEALSDEGDLKQAMRNILRAAS